MYILIHKIPAVHRAFHLSVNTGMCCRSRRLVGIGSHLGLPSSRSEVNRQKSAADSRASGRQLENSTAPRKRAGRQRFICTTWLDSTKAENDAAATSGASLGAGSRTTSTLERGNGACHLSIPTDESWNRRWCSRSNHVYHTFQN